MATPFLSIIITGVPTDEKTCYLSLSFYFIITISFDPQISSFYFHVNKHSVIFYTTSLMNIHGFTGIQCIAFKITSLNAKCFGFLISALKTPQGEWAQRL